MLRFSQIYCKNQTQQKKKQKKNKHKQETKQNANNTNKNPAKWKLSTKATDPNMGDYRVKVVGQLGPFLTNLRFFMCPTSIAH